MGWKGTVRSLNAAARKSNRESQKRQRELQNRQKEYAKMKMQEQAAYEVEVYENTIENLLSVHKECGEKIDWMSISKSEKPVEPVIRYVLEEKAKEKEKNYRPGFLTRIFKMEKRQREKLANAVNQAKIIDEKSFQKEHKKWKDEYDDWKESYDLAGRIIKNDPQSKIDIIKSLNPFVDISGLGTSIKFSIDSDINIVECELHVHGRKVIPSEIKSLLKNGSLSVKKMPIGKYNEILQDYICSCVLRIGRELFSIIPDDIVIITAVDELLNSSTGHLEKKPILSVAISRKTLEKLNMDTIDPSDAMSNFICNMSFKKTIGLCAVEKIQPSDITIE